MASQWRDEASAVLFHADGASRGNPGRGACGVVLSVFVGNEWLITCTGSRLIGGSAVSNTFAEVSGLNFARELLGSFLFKTLLLD